MAQIIQNPDSANLQRQLEQKSFEINYFKNQASEMQNQLQILQKVIQDLDATQQSLTVTDELTRGTLLPLGAGVYAKAKTEKTGTVLIDVGGRVLVEKKPDEATLIIQERKATAEKNLREIGGAFESVLQRIDQLTMQAEQMARQAENQ